MTVPRRSGVIANTPSAPVNGLGSATGGEGQGSSGFGSLSGLLFAIPALGIGLAALVLVRRRRRDDDEGAVDQ